jgi:hypothetical protein
MLRLEKIYKEFEEITSFIVLFIFSAAQMKNNASFFQYSGPHTSR